MSKHDPERRERLAHSNLGRQALRAGRFVREHDRGDTATAAALALRSVVPRYRRDVVGSIPPFVRTSIEPSRAAWLEHRWQHEMFDHGPDLERDTPTFDRGYWICMTPRSGSTYLSRMLGRTGILGRPMEYLNIEGAYRKGAKAPDFETYLQQVREDASTPNGVHGIKVAFDHIIQLLQRGLFPPPGDRFVYVSRDDLLMQGISYYRAVRSGVWTEPSPREPRAVRFDAAAIWDHVELIVRMRAQWERLFAYYDITPLRLTYEQIEFRPDVVVPQIAELLDVSAQVPEFAPEVRVKRQRDDTSVAWAERLRAAR